MKSLNKLLSYLGVFLFLFGLNTYSNAQTIYQAHLSGSNEVPAIISTASGSITATLTGTELVIEGSFSGLSGDYAASHIHSGMAGQSGGVVLALSPTVNEDMRGGMYTAANNTFTLTTEQIELMMNQGLYINVHSSTYGGGELRGQITPNADAQFRANLSGAFEVPSVKTMAFGGVVLQLTGDSLVVSGSFSNLSGTFAASHLHIGTAGSNGGVAFTLNVDAATDNLSGVYSPANNRFELTASQKTSLMNREFYVNVHTSEFGSGELRGQVTPPVTASFYTTLSGTAENPSVNTTAMGAAVLELTGDSVFVSGSFSGLSSAFAASHLHAGHAGTNGGVAFSLNVDSDTENTSGTYAVANNSLELTPSQIEIMVNRGIYVNVHSANFAGGELRGQVLGDARAYFKTNLASIHEIQPIESSASGALNLEVNGTNAILVGGFSGLESDFDASIAGGAHLHAGSVSSNGGVEVSINTTTSTDLRSGEYEASMNTVTLTEEQASTLFMEGMYANIHTTGNGSGELRGQLLFGDNMYPNAQVILSPMDDASLTLSNDVNTVFEATWESSTDSDMNEIAYIWQLSTDSEFNNILVNANTGSETKFTTNHGTVDALLAGAGVMPGGTGTVYHRVVVTDGSDEAYGVASSVNITRAEMIPEIFKAVLSGSNEVPSLVTTANGEITATLTGMELTIEGSFQNLSGEYLFSHIHSGMAGQNGGVALTLSPTVDGDMLSGMYSADTTYTLTAEQVTTLKNRGFYVNVHSEVYGGGELRGQLVPEADAYFRSNLSGAFEVPSVKTMAYGGIVAEMIGDSLFVSGSFSNLMDEFDANVAGGSHLHVGLAGSNGGIALALTPTLSEDNLSGVYMASDNAFELTSEQKMALMNRMMYVNIHTKAYASGELRGQVTPPVTASFYTTLSGSAENPSVNTTAMGAAVLELTGDSVFVSGSFSGLSSAFAASHLHAGHAGTNGGVAFSLNVDSDTENTSGTYAVANNSLELTPAQIEIMVNRGIYVNVHTANFAGGELRGQVLGDATAYFKTKLSGLHEIQPIITDAMGALNVEVSGSTAIVTGGFSGLQSSFDASIAGGAHLHAGPVTGNGGVEVLINTTVEEDTAGVYEASMNTVSLTEDQLAVLFNEGMYANIHTTGFGAGELRGQLLFGDNLFPEMPELTAPVDEAMLTLSGPSTINFEATWTESTDANGNELNYIWQLSTDADFDNLLVNASVGAETSFTADFATLDAIFESAGVEIGSTAMLYHRVIVSDGSNESISPTRTANIERGQVTASEDEIADKPLAFGLDQNYPNPFNPTTNISFTLSETGETSLKVYNMLGQEVASIVNGRLSAGSYNFAFDASQLSSGMYIYQLRAQNMTVTKRMTLIK